MGLFDDLLEEDELTQQPVQPQSQSRKGGLFDDLLEEEEIAPVTPQSTQPVVTQPSPYKYDPARFRPKGLVAPKAEQEIGTLEGIANAARNAFDSSRQALDIVGDVTPEEAQNIAKIEFDKQSRKAAPGYDEYQKAKGFDAVLAFAKNPIEVTSNIVAEGLAGSLPALGAGLAAGGVGAAAGSVVPVLGTGVGFTAGQVAGTFAGSLATEYGSKILEEMQEGGVDLTKPESIQGFFENEEAVAKARDKAISRGIPVAAFDAISAGIGGKLGRVIGKQFLTKTGEAAAELGVQAGLGGGGEVAGALVAGEPIEGKAVFGEIIGEAGPGAAEIITGRMADRAARVKAEEEKKIKAAAQLSDNLEQNSAPLTAAAVKSTTATTIEQDKLAAQLEEQLDADEIASQVSGQLAVTKEPTAAPPAIKSKEEFAAIYSQVAPEELDAAEAGFTNTLATATTEEARANAHNALEAIKEVKATVTPPPPPVTPTITPEVTPAVPTAQPPTTDATKEIIQPEGIRQEPQDRVEGETPAETIARNRILGAARGEEEGQVAPPVEPIISEIPQTSELVGAEQTQPIISEKLETSELVGAEPTQPTIREVPETSPMIGEEPAAIVEQEVAPAESALEIARKTDFTAAETREEAGNIGRNIASQDPSLPPLPPPQFNVLESISNLQARRPYNPDALTENAINEVRDSGFITGKQVGKFKLTESGRNQLREWSEQVKERDFAESALRDEIADIAVSQWDAANDPQSAAAIAARITPTPVTTPPVTEAVTPAPAPTEAVAPAPIVPEQPKSTTESSATIELRNKIKQTKGQDRRSVIQLAINDRSFFPAAIDAAEVGKPLPSIEKAFVPNDVEVPDRIDVTRIKLPEIKSKSPEEAASQMISYDDKRWVLGGVYFDSTNNMIVATDGRALVAIPKKITEDKIVAARNIKETTYQKSIKKGERIDGNYPNWKTTVPTYGKDIQKVDIDIDDARRASTILDSINNTFSNKIGDSVIVFNNARFNPKYILSSINALTESGAKSITAQIKSEADPLLLTGDNGAIAVIMPMRVTGRITHSLKAKAEAKPQPVKKYDTQALLNAAKPFTEYGSNYNRNIAASYERLNNAIDKGLSESTTASIAEELEIRLNKFQPEALAQVPTQPTPAPEGISVGNRVKSGRDPKVYVVEEVLPQTEAEQREGDYSVMLRDEKSGKIDRYPFSVRGLKKIGEKKIKKTEVAQITEPAGVATRKPATFPVIPSIEEQTAEMVYGGQTGLYDPFSGVQRKRVKAEDSAGRKGDEAQIKNADQHAAEIGGTVLYQDGDISLIRGYSIWGGNPVYIVANKDSRSKTDISSYTGKLVTPEQRSQLIDIKNKIEAQDQASFDNKPFITFTDGVAFSNGVPSTIAGVLSGWKSLLNIKSNLYVTTYNDAVTDKDKFNGPHRVIGSAGLASSKTDGSIRRMPNGDFYIMFREIPSKTKMLETLAHELGHLHEKEAFENASAATKQMLREEHSKWVKSQTGKTAKELVSSLRPVKAAKANLGAAEGMMADELSPYWKSFGEWYADQVSRWAVSSDKPLTIVDRFFSRIAKALKSFYLNITNQGYLPNETFVQYLEKTLNEPSRIVSEQITTDQEFEQLSQQLGDQEETAEPAPKRRKEQVGGAEREETRYITTPKGILSMNTDVLREKFFDGTSVSPEKTTQAWGYISRLLDIKSGNANELAGEINDTVDADLLAKREAAIAAGEQVDPEEDVSKRIGAAMFSVELMNYAGRLAEQGDTRMLKFMIRNVNSMPTDKYAGDISDAARALRTRLEYDVSGFSAYTTEQKAKVDRTAAVMFGTNKPSKEQSDAVKDAIDESEKTELGNAGEVAGEVEKVEKRTKRKITDKIEKVIGKGSLKGMIQAVKDTPLEKQQERGWIEKVVNDFLINAGLSPEAASTASKLYESLIAERFAAAKQKAFEDNLKKAAPWKNYAARNSRLAKDALNKVQAAIRTGVLDPEKNTESIIAAESGWSGFTKDQYQRIVQLDSIINDPKQDDVTRREAMADLNKVISDAKLPVRFKDALGAYYVGNALMGIPTLTVNIASPIGFTVRNLMTDVSKYAFTDPARIPVAFETFMESMRSWYDQTSYAFKNQIYLNDVVEYLQGQNVLRELFDKGKKQWSEGKYAEGFVNMAVGMTQITGRVLSSLDQGAISMLENQNITRYALEALANTKGKVPKDKLKEFANMVIDTRRKTIAENIANGMSRDRAGVLADLAVKSEVISALAQYDVNPMNVLDASINDALQSVGRNKTLTIKGIEQSQKNISDEGFMSYWPIKLLEMVSAGAGREGSSMQIFAKMLYGFALVPARVFHNVAWFSPYGFIRLGVDKYKKNKGEDSPYAMSLQTEAQYKQRLTEAIAGSVAMLGLAALSSASSDEDDDKKFKIVITGNGPSATTDKQYFDSWMKKWKPYSVHIVVNGNIIPINIGRGGEALFFPIMLAGALDDWKIKQKQNLTKKEPEDLSAIAQMLGSSFFALAQRGPYAAFTKPLFDASKDGRVTEELASQAGFFGKTFIPVLGSSLARNISDLFNDPVDRSSIEGAIYANTPVVGPWLGTKALNALGQPIRADDWGDRLFKLGVPVVFSFPKETPMNELNELILKQGSGPTIPTRANAQKRFGDILTDKEFETYVREYGRVMSDKMFKSRTKLANMKPADYDDELEKYARGYSIDGIKIKGASDSAVLAVKRMRQ